MKRGSGQTILGEAEISKPTGQRAMAPVAQTVATKSAVENLCYVSRPAINNPPLGVLLRCPTNRGMRLGLRQYIPVIEYETTGVN